MAKKLMSWKTKGMNRDLSVSAFNPEFAFENRNLRLSTNESNTMMSWVNEKGTLPIEIITGNWVEGDSSTKTTVTKIKGKPIGTAVINHQLVIFTCDPISSDDYAGDNIYVLKYANTEKTQMLCKRLFGGYSLGFDVDHPLETLVSYESESVQKVYWTDGKNQPRVININGNINSTLVTQFDFVPTLQLNEVVTIKKILGANGMFAPGVIQYAFTYYTKYGQESNIFYTSPLLYVSYKDRGASPEDRVENAFQISISGVDTNFDYLRIYSIQRTSVNGTPICKRIQDIKISGSTASYIDTGTSGNSIDPTELLYKGGEMISAETIEQKDNTIFLGNISINRPNFNSSIKTAIKNGVSIRPGSRIIKASAVQSSYYTYANQLTSYNSGKTKSVPCGGFKKGDTYRLGVQFQYFTGKWSDPVWVDDKSNTIIDPTASGGDITLPIFRGEISSSVAATLTGMGYKKMRGVVVFPALQDRNTLCQGVINPTLYTSSHRYSSGNLAGDLYAQSSWFFRASNGGNINSDGSASPASALGYLPYTSKNIEGSTNYNPEKNIRAVEVQGDYDDKNRFRIDRDFVTFHSPDVEFDSQLLITDYSSCGYKQVGFVNFSGNMSDIDIQTETPAISRLGGGFIHKSFAKTGSVHGIISGLFYDDCLADDDDDRIQAYDLQKSACKYMVYLWNKEGSLNNDINRPADKGVQTAKLKKKIISNLRYAGNTEYKSGYTSGSFFESPQVFSSDQVSIVKLSDKIYKGNIDTMLVPDNSEGDYFAFEHPEQVVDVANVKTPFNSNIWWKTFSKDPTQRDSAGYYRYKSAGWELKSEHLADIYLDLVIKKDPVRMKYKSSPHLVIMPLGTSWDNGSNASLPVIEITQTPQNRYGGQTTDALKENIWIPCGEPKSISDRVFYWEYGDTYYQRWDCLKTYAFTREDINQVVEIGSFMLETRVNIDGRYDRNRGQINNLNMSPENFNLLNPVYSQIDNFFSYRIQDDDFYSNTKFPNQITWSLTKENGADIDMWTNMNLASVLEMDGDKGKVNKLIRLNNQLFCFQDTGIAQILYNDNVQIQSTQGVPIEIANSGKVQGKDYKSDTVGCSNKWSIQTGAGGIYFIDSESRNIYLFNGQLNNISMQGGFNSWCKNNIPSSDSKWTPIFPEENIATPFHTCYDRVNQEVMFINRKYCLTFSERFGVFTSFYDYNKVPYFCSLDGTGIWITGNELYKHQAGEYCKFFGAPKPYSMILVGNPEPQTDKIFTNIEFRACVDGEGTTKTIGEGEEKKVLFDKFFLPFDSLDTWNEYQHGMATLSEKNGHSAMVHHSRDNSASLKRKFRIWRCDIPRDNGDNLDTFDETFDDTFHPLARANKHPLDRMRNPWLYLRLRKAADDEPKRVEIHDIVMTYYN